MDKPHIFWSKYWDAYECRLGQLSRIGPTAIAAWQNYCAAERRGMKR